jgi:hypothetical protein
MYYGSSGRIAATQRPGKLLAPHRCGDTRGAVYGSERCLTPQSDRDPPSRSPEVARRRARSRPPTFAQVSKPQMRNSATPPAGEVALGQVVRSPGTCPGPAGQFSGSRPEAHVGR